jgi:hypothetical protein
MQMAGWQPSQVRTGHPPPAVRGSNLKLETKEHQMSVVMAQAKIQAESVTDVQTATEKMFAAINAAHPEGIRYASVLLPDGETFLAVLQVDDGADNPIPGLPEFRELQQRVESSRVEPNSVQPLKVIGSYRLF